MFIQFHHFQTENIDDGFDDISQFIGVMMLNSNIMANNKKKLGCFINDCEAKLRTDFMALNPKHTVSNLIMKQKRKRKRNGVPKQQAKKDLTYNRYNETLQPLQSSRRTTTSGQGSVGGA